MPQEKTAVEWNKSFLRESFRSMMSEKFNEYYSCAENLAGEKEFADDDVPNEEKHENRESRSMVRKV